MYQQANMIDGDIVWQAAVQRGKNEDITVPIMSSIINKLNELT